jgi:hypothetical protein
VSTRQKRDADMDRLLRAVLKPAPQEGAGDCPDAGLLAAFVEGDLTADEQSALDTHIAACGRCQEALAVLAHDVPEVEEAIVAAPASGWFTWVTRPRLRWLVPISAAATVAVVIFATRPLIAPEGQVPGTEVARMAQTPSTPAAVPEAELDALRERPAPVPEKNESAGAGRRDEAAKALVGQPAASKVASDAIADAPPARQSSRDKQPAEPAAEMMAARMASKEKPAPAAAPAAAPPPGAGGQLAVPPRVASVPVAADEARKQAAAEPYRAIPVGAATKDARNLEAGPLIVPAPGGTVLWRLGAGGRISRSSDAGATWHEQVSGVTSDLLAGAAPSPVACWIVGAAGTVLLTTDGERWERRLFPEAVDLVAVAASSSRTAVVTARGGRRFETFDAGVTWSLKQ